MTDPRWRRIRQILEDALELEPSLRAAHLDSACGEDAELRHEVEALLAADQAEDDLLPDDGALPQWLEERVGQALVGTRVGSCRILRLLGAGGMGTVFEAEQEQPRRIVAVKVMRPSSADGLSLQRFELEAELLASLHHPNVAQVYEAGVHECDLGSRQIRVPYLVMEAIHGARSVTDYAEETSLGHDDRLRLFHTICDAIHHAHRQGLVHRDLKPANVLVDREGQLKVIDFGIALAPQRDGDGPHHERTIAGTARYMSPEQKAGNSVDRRADVYALGIVLRELVPEGGQEVGWLADKACAEEPDARYADAGELGADVARLLQHHPVAAAPTSASYRTRKFFRRNRLTVAASALALAGALAGVLGLATGLREARSQRDAARAKAEEAAAVLEFWQQMLIAAQPWRSGKDVTVGEVLDAVSSHLDSGFVDRPGIAAALHETVGWTLHGLGRPRDAEPHLRRAVEMMAELPTSDPRQMLVAEYRLAVALNDYGQREEAESILSDVATRADAMLGPEDDTTLAAHDLHAITLKALGRAEEAVMAIGRVLEISEAKFGARSVATTAHRNNLVSVLTSLGRNEAALTHAEQAAGVMRELSGDDHPDTLVTVQNQAAILLRLERFAEAEQLCREVLVARETVLGSEHVYTLLSRYWLGSALNGQGKNTEALQALAPAAEHAPTVLGTTHSYTGLIEIERARALHAVGDVDAATALLDDLLGRTPAPAEQTAWLGIRDSADCLRTGWVDPAAAGQTAR